MRLPDSFLQELKDRNNILDVVSGYVNLKRSGRTMSGLCPFHGEKTPSFHVNAEQGYFHCFGCGAGGDVITFIRKIENLDYIDAVKFLAQRAGMELPEDGRDEAAARIRGRIYEANRETARFFHRCLYSEEGKNALAYLRGRGLTERTIKHFGLGYSPNSRYALVRQLRSLGFRDEEIIRANLGFQGRYGSKGALDRFADRVMFPIIDLRGNVIGFGGRIMTDQKPKYLNTSDTMVFNKSQNLYALNFAKNAGEKRLILAEGYMDVIAMHEAGFDTAVCACGTALTAEQAKLLSEYADEVVLSYDSDEAGQKATERSLGIMANTPMKVSVLSYQGAKDPDEFIKKYGRERFEMLLNGTANPTEFQLKKAKAKYDLRSDDGRLSYIREAIGILTERGVSPTARDVYAGRLADETGVSKQAIVSQMQGAVQTAARRDRRRQQQELSKQGIAADIRVPYTSSGESALGAAAAARQLAAALMQNPDEIPYVRRRLDMATVLVPELQSVLQAIFQCADSGQPLNLTTLQQLLDDKAFQQIALAMAQNHDAPLQHQDIDMYLDRLESARPLDEKVRQMDDSQFSDFFANMGKKKGAKAEEPEE